LWQNGTETPGAASPNLLSLKLLVVETASLGDDPTEAKE